MADRHDRDDLIDWASGGSGWDPEPQPPYEPPPPRPSPDKKKREDGEPEKPESEPEKRGRLGGVGLVCGRFLPLHRGHQYVIDVARGCVQDVRVIVFASPADPIKGATRVRWLRELYPDASVELVERTTSTPPEVGEFVAAVRRGPAPRMLFGSELAYASAARAIGAAFVPVDPSRTVFPASGTALRADVMRHFDELPACVRPWFVRRVAVIGAESTGKSTLCAQLAEHYGTKFVPEYARTLAESSGGDLDADALGLAARGQIASEDALARAANRVLFCDTDARSLVAWHDRLFGSAPPWLGEAARDRKYDLVLLTSLDVPFVGRADRNRPAERRALHAKMLESHPGAIELTGDRTERFARAREAIDGLLARRGFLAARAPSLI